MAIAGDPSGPPASSHCVHFKLMVLLLPSLDLDGLLDLLFYRIEIERGRVLHRRVINCSHRQLPHVLLHPYKAPEFTRIEVVHVTAAEIVEVFAANGRRTLER